MGEKSGEALTDGEIREACARLSSERKQADVAQPLEDIYQARNRIAHHEPLYGSRLGRTTIAIDFVCRHLGQSLEDGRMVLSKLQALPRGELEIEAEKLREMLSKFSFK